MRVEWNPKDRVVPFIGACWWDRREVIVSLWPLVLRFGHAPELQGWRRD